MSPPKNEPVCHFCKQPEGVHPLPRPFPHRFCKFGKGLPAFSLPSAICAFAASCFAYREFHGNDAGISLFALIMFVLFILVLIVMEREEIRDRYRIDEGKKES